VRLISALKSQPVDDVGHVINLFVCIVLNYVLMERFGVVASHLATSLMYLIRVVFLGCLAATDEAESR